MCRCIYETQVFKKLILTTVTTTSCGLRTPSVSRNKKSYSFTHLVSDKPFFIAQLNALQMENTDTIGSDILDITIWNWISAVFKPIIKKKQHNPAHKGLDARFLNFLNYMDFFSGRGIQDDGLITVVTYLNLT